MAYINNYNNILMDIRILQNNNNNIMVGQKKKGLSENILMDIIR